MVAVSEYTRKQLFSWVLRGNHSLYPLQCTPLSWEPWAIENGQRAQGFRRMHTVPTVSCQCPKMWESVLSRQSRGPIAQLRLLPLLLCLLSPPLSWRFPCFSSVCPPCTLWWLHVTFHLLSSFEDQFIITPDRILKASHTCS